MKKHLLFHLLLVCWIFTFGQDTIIVGDIHYYSSSSHPRNMRSFHAKKMNHQEIIKYSDSSYKVESCYYYDSIRIVEKIDSYSFEENKLLIEGNESGHYEYVKMSDTLYIIRRMNPFVEVYGYATHLLPLTMTGIETYVSKRTNDTLYWIEYFDSKKPIFTPHFYSIPDSLVIYRKGEVDKIPKFSDGKNIDLFLPTLIKPCSNCDPRTQMGEVSIIIDTCGFIHLENVFGINEYYYDCLYLYFEQLDPCIPATIRNKKVNVRINVKTRSKTFHEIISN